jgi:hypothetical protein
MKINRNNWLLIMAGVLSIVIAGLGVFYLKQVEQQRELNQKFAQTAEDPVKHEIAGLELKKADLEAQINAASSQLEIARAEIPSQSMSSITQVLFDVAGSYGMDVTELVSAVPTKQALDGVDFSALNLTLQAEGDASKMSDFVVALNGSFTTGVIQSVIVTLPEKSGDKASIKVDMAVYSN